MQIEFLVPQNKTTKTQLLKYICTGSQLLKLFKSTEIILFYADI